MSEKLIEQYTYDLKQMKTEHRKLNKKRKSILQINGLDSSYGVSPWDVTPELREVHNKMSLLSDKIRTHNHNLQCLIHKKSEE
jgi:hypothetical protein